MAITGFVAGAGGGVAGFDPAGAAGLGAAVGAASAGADVILAERYGFLGGSATVGLVMPMMSFYNRRARYERATPRQTCAYCRAITAPARPSSAECSRCS